MSIQPIVHERVDLPSLPPMAAESFTTFGYAKLPQVIAGRQRRLFDEIDALLPQAYPDTQTQPENEDGRTGYFLPAMDERTPTSLALVEALEPWAAELLGVEAVVPVYADISVFFGPTPWHTDIGMGIPFVKFSTYADALDAGNGALRFVPGSHRDPFNAALRPVVRRLEIEEDLPVEETVRQLPHVVVDTDPGDVVAIHGRVWHATTGGARREQWSVPFVSATDADLARRFFESFLVASATRGHDGPGFPFFGEAFLRTETGRRVVELGGADVASWRQVEPA